MKICPRCQSIYTNSKLFYCLKDGTELINQDQDLAGHNFDETEKSTNYNSIESFDLDSIQDEHIEKKSETLDSEQGNFKNSSYQRLIVLSVVLFFCVVAVFGYFYSNGHFNGVVESWNSSKGEAGKKSNSTKLGSEETRAEAKKEVEEALANWILTKKMRNIYAYMNHYAPTVDYFFKKQASKSFVFKDKQRAFTIYEKMESTISEVVVEPSNDGKTVVATFDKEWDFIGNTSHNGGKVRTQLTLKKVYGEWLITSEKDLKVYYVKK